jgi:small subunit ribosomal protein S3Ae
VLVWVLLANHLPAKKMAVGKNKKLGKKKGAKKTKSDPFARKEWYHVRAPGPFTVTAVGRTMTTKTTGQRLARDSLIGRVFEVSLGELKEHAEDDAFRKFKLKCEDVQGTTCLTNFHGMDLTTDKLRSLVRKWHTLIEAHADIKTTDGYAVRLFCIGFTKGRPNQNKKTSYAQSAQTRAIRKKMVEIIERETSNIELKDVVGKLTTEIIGGQIEKATQGIYPLQNVLIRKVKVLRTPKLDVSKLMELHGGAAAVEELGKKVERPEDVAASGDAADAPMAAEATA